MWAKMVKKLLGLGLLGIGLNSNALPLLPIATTCSATPYHPPAAIHKIYMGQNKPFCKDEFLEKLKASRLDDSCKGVINKMVDWSVNHVRPIVCNDGKIGNAVFLSKKVFMGNAHRFYDPVKLTVRKTESQIGACFVPRFDKSQGFSVKNFVNTKARLEIADPSDTGGDHAVGSLIEPLDDVEPVDVDKMILKQANVGDEVWIMSAVNSIEGPNRGCFAIGSGTVKNPFYPADGDFSSIYSSDAPGDPGTSGSPIFKIIKDASGKCIDFGIVALQSGEEARLPDGSPYHYPEYTGDPNSMAAAHVGVDSKFRQDIKEVLEDSQRREYSESRPVRSKVPAGQDL